MNEWRFNDTPSTKTDRLLGVRVEECKAEIKEFTSLALPVDDEAIQRPRSDTDNTNNRKYTTWAISVAANNEKMTSPI